MCHYCKQERCLDSERVCGCNPRKEGYVIQAREWPKAKVVKKISCEYCGQETNRKKPTRPMDFVFKNGIHLCLECASKPRCDKCDGELSRLGCMLCRNDIRNVLNKG